MTERPFELHLGDAVVSGRADVILDPEDGVIIGLVIVDYKTSTSGDGSHDLQLQVYANAGRRENLDVRAAHGLDLKRGERTSVDVAPHLKETVSLPSTGGRASSWHRMPFM